jgi:hypothetical protein
MDTVLKNVKKTKRSYALDWKRTSISLSSCTNRKIHSPGFGTELVTDWGTFWLINSTQ